MLKDNFSSGDEEIYARVTVVRQRGPHTDLRIIIQNLHFRCDLILPLDFRKFISGGYLNYYGFQGKYIWFEISPTNA